MKKIMKIFKNPLFTFIIGGILFSSIIVIAESINSSEILYDNSNSVTSYDNVQDVLNEMYNIIEHNSTGFSLLMHSPTGLSTELIGGLYRYQGIQDGTHDVDNYICFGTTNKNECTNNTDFFMYRIIGISPSGQMKLIKKYKLSTDYVWHSTYDVEWPNSSLFAGLNGSYFLTNTDYIPDSSWSDRIVLSDWHYATTTDKSVSTIMSKELSGDVVRAKIGLMYLHDYAYALENPEYSGHSWIQSYNNIVINSSGYEWCITRNSSVRIWNITTYNQNNTLHEMYYSAWVRPVFFLNSTETIASGSGTITDPYILN